MRVSLDLELDQIDLLKRKIVHFVYLSQMAGITVRNVTVLNNPASFTDPFSFEIQYEAIQPLEEGRILPFIIPPLCGSDLEWKVTYLSTPEDDSLDQELESVLVGPIAPGVYKFVLEVSLFRVFRG